MCGQSGKRSDITSSVCAAIRPLGESKSEQLQLRQQTFKVTLHVVSGQELAINSCGTCPPTPAPPCPSLESERNLSQAARSPCFERKILRESNFYSSVAGKDLEIVLLFDNTGERHGQKVLLWIHHLHPDLYVQPLSARTHEITQFFVRLYFVFFSSSIGSLVYKQACCVSTFYRRAYYCYR